MKRRRIYLKTGESLQGPFLWRSVARMLACGKLPPDTPACMDADIQQGQFVPVETLIERCRMSSAEGTTAVRDMPLLFEIRRQTAYPFSRKAVDWLALAVGALSVFLLEYFFTVLEKLSFAMVAGSVLVLLIHFLAVFVAWQLLRMIADFMDIRLRQYANCQDDEK